MGYDSPFCLFYNLLIIAVSIEGVTAIVDQGRICYDPLHSLYYTTISTDAEEVVEE